jgi:hypothetical protein
MISNMTGKKVTLSGFLTLLGDLTELHQLPVTSNAIAPAGHELTLFVAKKPPSQTI